MDNTDETYAVLAELFAKFNAVGTAMQRDAHGINLCRVFFRQADKDAFTAYMDALPESSPEKQAVARVSLRCHVATGLPRLD